MRAVDSFHKGLNASLRWFCVILFALLVLLVLTQVVVRFLDVSLPWTEVSARVVFIWQAVIGAAYVIGEKEDVAIDWLVRKMPVGGVKAVSLLAHAIVALFAVWVMIWGGMRNVLAGWEDTVQLLPVTQGQTFLVIPIAGALILVYSVLHVIDLLRASDEAVVARADDDIDLGRLNEEGI
ncbi:TRAP transporter small permease [Auraticoccus monumenti]|uniref:TRAP-type C4-dicarboxylate transport system, small permease component n=1 Tax=Auraticoccus monumenti TaxID=675864 RepID=A0A1G7DZE0_9ACTN|nr:TRAP transporter small permease subunit [Auraticoccus monumenti]SDE56827.1 TRAP-type C4-dicarboxylate transport system, small permease component [Auraticoccus monumenti]